MSKPKSSVPGPATPLPPRSSVAQAIALSKPVKSVSIPAEPTYDVSGEPKIYTPDPNPHALATLAREEAIPRVTAIMDAQLRDEAEEIVRQVWSGNVLEFSRKVRDDWEAGRVKAKTVHAALRQVCPQWQQRDGSAFSAKSCYQSLNQEHNKLIGKVPDRS